MVQIFSISLSAATAGALQWFSLSPPRTVSSSPTQLVQSPKQLSLVPTLSAPSASPSIGSGKLQIFFQKVSSNSPSGPLVFIICV